MLIFFWVSGYVFVLDYFVGLMNTAKILDDDSRKRVDLDNPKRVHDDYPNYPDESDDDYESSVETNPRWGRELDSKGEPNYTPEPNDPNHVYNSKLYLLKVIVSRKNGLIALVHLQVCLWSLIAFFSWLMMK